jgi:hypothetical protein
VPHAPFLVVAVGAAVLLFHGLGDRYLWQDEAFTGVLGERLLKDGRPLVYDGRNILTMDSFADEDARTIDGRTGSADAAIRYLVARGDFRSDLVWTAQPWGQFLVAGLSLAALGHGTWAARAPFALAGLLTIVLLYALAWRVFRDRGLALLAAGILAANGFFILHARQCRYYALSSLALTASVAAFARWRAGRRFGAPLFVVVGWCYFQCDFGSFIPAMTVLFAVALLEDWPRVGRPLAVFGVLGAAVAPFAAYYGILGRVRATGLPFGEKLARNAAHVNEYLAAFALLAAAVILLWRRRRELERVQRELLTAAIAIVVALLAWVPAVAPFPFHRYVVEATPLAVLVAAWVARSLAASLARRWPAPWVGALATAALAIALGGTRLAPAAFAWALPARADREGALLRPELPLAWSEIFSPGPDPNRLVIEAVAARLRPGDEVLVNYEDVPFMFYTDARVRGGVAAFRVEDRSAPPPRFLVLRRSVGFVHWPVFEREARRWGWRPFSTGAPDVPFGNCPDPELLPAPPAADEVLVAERAER